MIDFIEFFIVNPPGFAGSRVLCELCNIRILLVSFGYREAEIIWLEGKTATSCGSRRVGRYQGKFFERYVNVFTNDNGTQGMVIAASS